MTAPPVPNVWRELNIDSMSPLIPQMALRGVLVLLAAVAAVWLLRRRSAAVRHLVWSTALGMLVLMPALLAVVPPWPVRAPWSFRSGTAPVEGRGGTSADRAPVVQTNPLVSVEPRAGEASRMAGFWILVWGLGTASVLAMQCVSRIRLRSLLAATVPISEGPLVELLPPLAQRLGVRRTPVLRRGGPRAMPMTWGVIRIGIFFPADADEWPRVRQEAVLLHELAHIARCDLLSQRIAEIACALHWFNPLVWHAARRVRAESEHACDDQVLGAGTPATEYATELVVLARALGEYRRAAFAVAEPSQLKSRISALLDQRRDRASATRSAWMAASGGFFLLGVPLATAEPRLPARVYPPPVHAASPALPPALPGTDPELTPWLEGPISLQWTDGRVIWIVELRGRASFSPDTTRLTSLTSEGRLSITRRTVPGTERRSVAVAANPAGVIWTTTLSDAEEKNRAVGNHLPTTLFAEVFRNLSDIAEARRELNEANTGSLDPVVARRDAGGAVRGDLPMAPTPRARTVAQGWMVRDRAFVRGQVRTEVLPLLHDALPRAEAALHRSVEEAADSLWHALALRVLPARVQVGTTEGPLPHVFPQLLLRTLRGAGVQIDAREELALRRPLQEAGLALQQALEDYYFHPVEKD